MTAPLPPGALRLFPDHDAAGLAGEGGRSLLLARLLEDGDAADLAWLVGAVPEPEVAAWLGRCGGRLLSARSRAFWEVVLGRPAGPAMAAMSATESARELWPL